MIRVEDVEKEIFAKATSTGLIIVTFVERESGIRMPQLYWINPDNLSGSKFTNKKKFRSGELKKLSWIFEEHDSFIVEFKGECK